ncbi:MAG: helix-turn-helix domain-containing protein, partial [Candidatus Saccharibacteria bacterium]
AEEDAHLQDRIKKASEYFLVKLDQVIAEPFSSATLETDNKAIRKIFNEAADKLQREIQVKRASLSLCKQGFNLKPFLETKAKAAIDMTDNSQKKPSPAATSFSLHPDFYMSIKKWRDEKADSLDMEVRRVLPQNTMLQITELLPVSRAELKTIKGMGGTRMQQFGKEILELVISYKRKKGLAIPTDAEEEASMAALSSPQNSFLLYKKGKTIEEIARERKMAVSTIEGHLSDFVATGEIPLHELVAEHKSKKIIEYIEKSRVRGMNDLRAALGNEYTYSEIRFVIRYLEGTRQSI